MADFEEMHNAHRRATSDDIATRLRQGDANYKHLHEAADEIERLRKENEHLRVDLKMAMEANDNLMHYLHERKHD